MSKHKKIELKQADGQFKIILIADQFNTVAKPQTMEMSLWYKGKGLISEEDWYGSYFCSEGNAYTTNGLPRVGRIAIVEMLLQEDGSYKGASSGALFELVFDDLSSAPAILTHYFKNGESVQKTLHLAVQ